mgnify:CR=1 FL=1
MQSQPLNPHSRRRFTLFAVVFLILILAIGLLASCDLTHLDWHGLRENIRDSGFRGPLICMLLYILFTLLFIPSTPLSLIVGAVYGVVAGTVYASIGTLIGATLAFLIGRYALHRSIRRWIGDGKTFHWIDEGIKNDPWRIIVISRMFPITPYNFLNYAYGLTGVSLAKYMIASWLGMLPPIIAWVWTAAAAGRIAEGNADKKIFIALLVGTAFFALISYMPRLIRKWFPPPS